MFFDADPQSDTWGLILSLIKRQNRCELCFTELQNLFTKIIDQRMQRKSQDEQSEQRKFNKDADYLQLVVDNVERLPDGSLDYR